MPPVPKMPSRRNQDPAHVMDFPSLNLGYAPCSKQQCTLVDLDITVYGLEEIQGSDKEVAVVVSHPPPYFLCNEGGRKGAAG